MDRKNARKVVNSLNDLLIMLDQKELEREGAKRYNKTKPLRELEYDLPALALEIKELELDFKQLSRSL